MMKDVIKNKKIIITAVVIIAVLVLAFCFGGNAPGAKGDLIMEQALQTASEETTAQAEAAKTQAEAAAQAAAAKANAEQAKAEQAAGMQIDPKTGKDKYNTTPVPKGKPIPVEPQEAKVSNTTHICTVSISCATILNNMDYLAENKRGLVPADGWILKATQVSFKEGESVFDVLQRVTKDNKIHMESSFTPMYNSAYIEGINNLYEFDCGELSGWMYSVNGWFPNYGCSRYQVQAGDVIKWVFTCDLGKDVGGSNGLR